MLPSSLYEGTSNSSRNDLLTQGHPAVCLDSALVFFIVAPAKIEACSNKSGLAVWDLSALSPLCWWTASRNQENPIIKSFSCHVKLVFRLPTAPGKSHRFGGQHLPFAAPWSQLKGGAAWELTRRWAAFGHLTSSCACGAREGLNEGHHFCRHVKDLKTLCLIQNPQNASKPQASWLAPKAQALDVN